jgi:hypothetical protein
MCAPVARDGSVVIESENVEFHGSGEWLATEGTISREVNQRMPHRGHAVVARAASGWKWT